MHYLNGIQPRPLDILSLTLGPHHIDPAYRYQTENYIIPMEGNCTHLGTFPFGDLNLLCDDVPRLWIHYGGRNDRIPVATANASIHNSLLLIKPQNIEIIVEDPNPDFNQRQRPVRASYSFKGEHYNLKITDERILSQFQT
jgi:hypothetical protein